MTTQSEAWKNLFDRNEEKISDGDLMQAYAEVNNTVCYLKRIGEPDQQIQRLTEWSEKISKIQSDRQAANRPELPPKVTIGARNGQVVFYGVSGSDWTTDTSQQTERLRNLLESVYETTTMVKR